MGGKYSVQFFAEQTRLDVRPHVVEARGGAFPPNILSALGKMGDPVDNRSRIPDGAIPCFRRLALEAEP